MLFIPLPPFSPKTPRVLAIIKTSTLAILNARQHIHQACSHPFLGDSQAPGIKTSFEWVSSTPDQPAYFQALDVIVHPRWCNACIAERTNIIESLPNPVEDTRPSQGWSHIEELAFKRGVREGRVLALSREIDFAVDSLDAVIMASDLNAPSGALQSDPAQDAFMNELLTALRSTSLVGEDEEVADLSNRLKSTTVMDRELNQQQRRELELLNRRFGEGRVVGLFGQWGLEQDALYGSSILKKRALNGAALAGVERVLGGEQADPMDIYSM
ncbi:uncharacterized protein PAC_02619 [Phialocephala subalpina]|uniref:Uncharacterized protein n=1 Tax=Phialocephala subalpina TaxID=576137 RepID=A0A1L7WIZ7_9HELO|nr:uncharacterized protein PAC_02619 [Phialocephala subalpina]